MKLGLQLYSVRALLPKDYAGTLARVAAIGYTEVEAAGFYGHTPAEVKAAMQAAGLQCVSGHYALHALLGDEAGTLRFARDAGLESIVCSAPYSPDEQKLRTYPGGEWQGILHALTLEDWHWNARQFNRLGALCQAQGLKFGYHNHTAEFRRDSAGMGYDVLLAETDPALVTLELDCGWAVASGQDPVELLRKHPRRFSMLHVKDLKAATAGMAPDQRISTVAGQGVVDYRPILAAAAKAGVRHAFVEQEDFDGEILSELAADYRNLRAMSPLLT
ncbi:MAG TPA: sugar phosphate isomerase/epimerase [Acidobacteriaceae bacterium]